VKPLGQFFVGVAVVMVFCAVSFIAETAANHPEYWAFTFWCVVVVLFTFGLYRWYYPGGDK